MPRWNSRNNNHNHYIVLLWMALHVLRIRVLATRDTSYVSMMGTTSHAWIDKSLKHLVDFVDNVADHHEVVMTELNLDYVKIISDPSDGGVDVLRGFFARNDTTLTKVTLPCRFALGSTATTTTTAAATTTACNR
jgi:hypothetical protein